MRILLDTHVWLWGLLDPERLSSRSRRLLAAEDNELWLSSISVWEALVLAQRGKLQLQGEAQAWLASALERAPLNELPVNTAIAMRSRSIKLPHQDPADRFLAASADIFDLSLMTADKRLLANREIKTISAV